MFSSCNLAAADIPAKLEGEVGKSVQLALNSHPSTGYRWMIKHLPPQLLFVSSDYQPADNRASGLVGAPGKQTFTFIAQCSGTATLQLIYGRAFEPLSWQEISLLITIG